MKLHFLRVLKVGLLALGLTNSVKVFPQSIDSVQNISPVLVTNHKNGSNFIVKVKWITDDLIYPLGVYVYRQEFGELTWAKLNQKPIIKGQYLPSKTEYDSDSTLRQYVDMAKEMKISDFKEMVKAFVLIKSVQSEGFARFLGIEFIDSLVAFDKTYRYKVIAVNRNGDLPLGHSEYIKVKDFVSEQPPSGIEIKAFDKKVSINWQPEDLRFHAVNIYRSSSKDSVRKRVNDVPLMISKRELPNGEYIYPDEFYTERDLENKVKYTYQLVGIDFFGRETRMSNKITVMPGDKTSPLTPYNLKCKVDKYNVKLSWLNQYSPDQEGINIYRSYKTDKKFVRINSTLLHNGDTTYLDEGLTPGFYYYMVAAIDSAANEGQSAMMLTQVHDITPPSIPRNLVAKADTGRIALSWDRNVEEDLLGYQVYRTINSDRQEYMVLLNSDPFYNNSFTDTLPVNARNNFVYKVVALDSSLNRSGYSLAVKAKMPDVTPPEQPVIIGVNPTDSYLSIEWIPNVELDLAGYDLFKYTDSPKNQIKLNTGLVSPYVKRFTDRTISADTIYNYVLQAVDSAGNRSQLSKSYLGIFPSKSSDQSVSELILFGVKKPLFSKVLRLEWKVAKSDSFIGCAVYRRNSADDEPKRIVNLTQENRHIDGDKKKPTVQYQLRIYHSTGQVVKSDWVSSK